MDVNVWESGKWFLPGMAFICKEIKCSLRCIYLEQANLMALSLDSNEISKNFKFSQIVVVGICGIEALTSVHCYLWSRSNLEPHSTLNAKSVSKKIKLVQHCISKMPAPTYLISKVGDPLFALFIGLSAAVIRINREEKELGHSSQQTIDAGFR